MFHCHIRYERLHRLLSIITNDNAEKKINIVDALNSFNVGKRLPGCPICPIRALRCTLFCVQQITIIVDFAISGISEALKLLAINKKKLNFSEASSSNRRTDGRTAFVQMEQMEVMQKVDIFAEYTYPPILVDFSEFSEFDKCHNECFVVFS